MPVLRNSRHWENLPEIGGGLDLLEFSKKLTVGFTNIWGPKVFLVTIGYQNMLEIQF